MGFYQRIGVLIPKPIVKAFEREAQYIGMDMPRLQLAGFVFSFGFAISIGISLCIYALFQWPIIVTLPLLFLGFVGGTYFWLSSVAEGRGRFVEKILPDVLQLVASNMKSGLTTERALLVSARPEFGVFSDELKMASAKVLAGERIEEALLELAEKIKSQTLERTMKLMLQGIKSGGNVAELLSQLADDLREENAMKEETKSEVSMYAFLIFFGAAMGAPILFSVSSYMVGMMQKQSSMSAISPEQLAEIAKRSPAGRFGRIGMGGVAITEDFATTFAIVSLIATCIFASLLMGVMNTGKEKDGIKYIPIVLLIALGLFFIMRIVLASLLGNISALM